MAEFMGGIHPDSADLQMYADGESGDDGLATHVASCATCREEAAAIRRVNAALSLTSRAPDSLSASIKSRRAGRAATAKPLSHGRSNYRVRRAFLPIGLAAAAALVLLVPRAWREADPVAEPVPGAKGVMARDVVFETVMGRWSQPSIDSVVAEALKSNAGRIEITYVAENDDANQARLADSVSRHLLEKGVNVSDITVRHARQHGAVTPALRPGAVKVTIFAERDRADPP